VVNVVVIQRTMVAGDAVAMRTYTISFLVMVCWIREYVADIIREQVLKRTDSVERPICSGL
jgi:hypothetical protein